MHCEDNDVHLSGEDNVDFGNQTPVPATKGQFHKDVGNMSTRMSKGCTQNE
jgi:hypothetical protein